MSAFAIELTTPACPVKDQMRDQAHAIVSSLPGVSAVEVTMTAQVRSASGPDAGRAPVPGVKNVIAVGAGKGGVGKTTVAVNLAIALARCGSRVGMIDGDIYGPNVPIMLGLSAQLTTDGQKIIPAQRYGLDVVSMGFLTGDDAPVIWRGPMLHGVIQQFFREVRWSNLDYLVVDMPPGTGDVALSLSQTVPVAGAIVVTTPQAVSLADSRRAIRMYQKLNIPTLGIIENMSHFVCPSCLHESDIFGKGGGERIAEEMGIPFLGRIPIYEPIRVGGDHGRADCDFRTRVAGGPRVHGGGGTGSGSDLHCELPPADSAHTGELSISMAHTCNGADRPLSLAREAGAACRRGFEEGRRMMKVVAIALLLVGCSDAGGAADAISGIVDPYLRIQLSLADDKMDNVKAEASAIATEAAKIGDKARSMVSAAERLAAASDLAKARDAFGQLSDALLDYAEDTKSALGEASRVAYCPMVRKSWVQKGDAVVNPYMGKEMLGCGELKKSTVTR